MNLVARDVADLRGRAQGGRAVFMLSIEMFMLLVMILIMLVLMAVVYILVILMKI